MNAFQTLRIVYFSPTHTSKRIARAVAEGIGIPRRIETDLTFDESTTPINIKDELIIIAAPVYAGRVAPVALQRIRRIQAENCPAILLAVYGNRDYEDALLELRDTATALGCTPLSAGAFIGEHSYSSPEMPIAAGRPDTSDLQCARQFGADSLKKLNELLSQDKEISTPEIPSTCCFKSIGGKLSLLLGSLFVKGTSPYKLIQAGKSPFFPMCNERCFVCGECLEVCPTHALRISEDGSQILTDEERCIRCCACVKECPNEAREYHTPFAAILHEKFSERKEPELFL